MATLSAFPSSAWLIAALSAVLACAGCSQGESDERGNAGGTGGTAGQPGGPVSLSYDPPGTLALIPGEVRKLEVVAKPAGVHLVRFALLGDAKDASLDKSEAETHADGRVDLVVTAPSSATTFSIRVSSGETTTISIPAAVSASGFATLQVKPAYQGKRSVSHWVAGVRTGVTCAELAGDFTSDGDLKGTAPAEQIPQVNDVPVGPAFAVTLRGAESIAGCADLAEVAAGEVNFVTVPVSDLPMRLDGVDLIVNFGLEGGKGKWASVFDVEAALAAFAPGVDDSSVVLDAMRDALADPAQESAFDSARKNGDWDNVATQALGGPSAVRDALRPWLEEGAENFATPDAIHGRLTGVSADAAWVQLDTIAGNPAGSAGFLPKYLVKWQAQPDDRVAFGVDLALLPSALLASLAELPAKKAVTGSTSVTGALAETLSCKKLGEALVAAGASPGLAFPKCDLACVTALCGQGLEKSWKALVSSSSAWSAAPGQLSIKSTADATLDDSARPKALEGTWVGSFQVGPNSLAVGGSTQADVPPPPS